MILVEPKLKTLLKKNQNASLFDSIMQLSGTVYREQPGRKTLSFQADGQRYFAKLHFGVGWFEIFKNLLQGKPPILGALNEWTAIKALKAAGIDTLTPVGFGQRGRNPAKQTSFLLTEALEDTVNLETLANQWATAPLPSAMKRALITRLGYITQTLQALNIAHRDYYLCHFLLPKSAIESQQFTPKTPLYLIDLHRALQFKTLPARWRIKDLAGLYFSSMNIPLQRTDHVRFLKAYYGENWKQAFRSESDIWQKVLTEAQHMQHKFLRHQARQAKS